LVANAETRLYFVDYLRAAIITLVILHHVAVIYVANIPFYYVEPNTDALTFYILIFFVLFNQAWFMGLFFLLSGYFTPSSFDRKGPKSFLKDRLVRLGIPLLIFSFVLNPLMLYIGVPRIPAAFLAKAGYTLPPLTWQNYPMFIGFGPLWFIAMLLVFDFGYAAWRVASKKMAERKAHDYPSITYRTVAIFILLLAAASYLIRIIVPMGRTILNFPTISYLPQYISFFLIGVIAFHNDWLRKLSSSMAKRVCIVALLATCILFPLSLSGEHFLGNGYWQSGVYALWDSIFAVGVSMGLIVLFRRFYDVPGRFWQFLSQHYYTVYIIHIPIIVPLAALVLSRISIEPLLKFGLAAVVTVPICWGTAYLIRKIPFVDKVL
jgi:Acyltransferase family